MVFFFNRNLKKVKTTEEPEKITSVETISIV
jgi:hypothetical protein